MNKYCSAYHDEKIIPWRIVLAYHVPLVPQPIVGNNKFECVNVPAGIAKTAITTNRKKQHLNVKV